MSAFTAYCLLLTAILVSLPAASHQFPDLKGFLAFWDTSKPLKREDVNSASNSGTEEKEHSRQKRQDVGDSSQYPYSVEISRLPFFNNGTLNDRYMPVLGNGFISTSVYSKYIHLNGLFNGKGADSHRARVPSVITTRVKLDDDLEGESKRRFNFNVFEGVFTETIDTPTTNIIHRTYIHQKYIRLIITDIRATRTDDSGGTFDFEYEELDNSEDILFEEPQVYKRSHWQASGRTYEKEHGSSVSSVHCLYFRRHHTISTITDKERHDIMIQAIDMSQGDAQYDFDRALEIIGMDNGIDNLFDEHKKAWKTTWDQGKIEVHGELQLSKITLFSQYYLLASFPPLAASKSPSYQTIYSSIARTSLARGSKDKDYRGHAFWDNEMYIMPALLLFHPKLAKAVIRIRSVSSEVARDYALTNGRQGYQYPWESAFSGRDVTPDSCPDCRNNALHVTGAVGWSIRQYYSATRDKDFMTNTEFNACDMTKEIARFFAELAVYNNSIGRYDINNVTGPDDWHPKVNNNAYTNVLASLAIHWARYFACLCGRPERDEVPDRWMAVADFLELPFDNEQRTHFQFQGYDKLPESNKTIKQADTILLTYPLNWNMSRDIMRNDLEMYEHWVAGKTPAMTYSFMSVGYKWGDDPGKMNQYFQKSYYDYVKQPFKIWMEYMEQNEADQAESAVNYLPGAGGFLQSLVYGYAGIRIRPEFLEFHSPSPPPSCSSMVFTSFDYLGTEMDIDIRPDRVILNVKNVGDYPLVLKRNVTSVLDEPLTVGGKVTIDDPKLGFYILTTDGTACDHPRDFIYMPWGYSPWLSTGNALRTNLMAILFSISVLILLSNRHFV